MPINTNRDIRVSPGLRLDSKISEFTLRRDWRDALLPSLSLSLSLQEKTHAFNLEVSMHFGEISSTFDRSFSGASTGFFFDFLAHQVFQHTTRSDFDLFNLESLKVTDVISFIVEKHQDASGRSAGVFTVFFHRIELEVVQGLGFLLFVRNVWSGCLLVVKQLRLHTVSVVHIIWRMLKL